MKKFKQLSLSILVASSFVVISGSTLAASGGVVNFSGKVVNTPCGISTETATQNITFNDISKAHLSTDGATSEIRDLNIDLVNCDLSAPEGSEEAFRSVTVSFTGSTNGNNNTETGNRRWNWSGDCYC
ncbi:type 1 fimbrial protein [Vibrio metschnikovii]